MIFPQQYLCLVYADFLFVCQYQHIANLGAKILVVGKQGIDKNEGFYGCEIDADKQEPNTAETYIHTGTGLPEWSALAVKEKEEAEESKEYIREAMKKVRRDLNARSGRNQRNNRNGSIVRLGSESPVRDG